MSLKHANFALGTTAGLISWATILQSANGGITKTQLLTQGNLPVGSPDGIRQYSKILVQKKLRTESAPVEDRRDMTYCTTALWKSHKVRIVFF
jgi:hypothetical protein